MSEYDDMDVDIDTPKPSYAELMAANTHLKASNARLKARNTRLDIDNRDLDRNHEELKDRFFEYEAALHISHQKNEAYKEKIVTQEAEITILGDALKYARHELRKVTANAEMIDAQAAALETCDRDMAALRKGFKHYKKESESANLTAELRDIVMRDAQEEYQPQIHQQQQFQMQLPAADAKICKHWMEMGRCFGGLEGATCKNGLHPSRETGANNVGALKHRQV